MTKIDPLEAISPLDGRYRSKTAELQAYFSEAALIKYRLRVEVEYLIELSQQEHIRKLTDKEIRYLRNLYQNFQLKNARRVKVIEKETNHDVKAVEYYLRQSFSDSSLKDLSSYIHFALTSEDVTNLAYALLITDFIKEAFVPTIADLTDSLTKLAKKHAGQPMLARTHGQPASPTTFGKEMAVYYTRLICQLERIPTLTGKLNGAVGNYNAHQVAFPKADWIKFSIDFIDQLGLEPNLYTTQIENHDTLAELMHTATRINTILIDFNQDIWLYISQKYLIQQPKKGEVGSSTMPHKINPIDFENAEGNLKLANTLLLHLAQTLPVSRLQRDLSGSTQMRNLGVAFSHSILAYQSTLKGLKKIKVNRAEMNQGLKAHPEVLAEAIQTILRKEGNQLAYEQLKDHTRGQAITLKTLHHYIDQLDLPTSLKKRLKNLTPQTYTGIAAKLTNTALKDQ